MSSMSKKILLIYLLFIFLLGCKQTEKPIVYVPTAAPITPTAAAISTDFEPYINSFKSEAIVRNKIFDYSSLSVSYDHTLSGSNVLGVCTWGGLNPPRITINPTYWQAWAANGRVSEMQQLIYHELGHCILNRMHDDRTVNTVDNGTAIAISLMNSYHLTPTVYERNYEYYLNELYDQSIAVLTVNLYYNGTKQFPTGLYASMAGAEHTTVISAAALVDDGYYVRNETIDGFRCDDAPHD